MKRHTSLVHDKSKNIQNSQESKDVVLVANDVEKVANDVVLVANDVEKVANDVVLVANDVEKVATKYTYTCDKCGRGYMQKRFWNKHIEDCKGINYARQCIKCGKIFTDKFAKYHHIQKGCEGVPTTVQNIQNITNNITNNNNTTNNNTININILNFCSENTSYITEEFARKCFDSGVHGLRPMIDKLYFDDEHPENHNTKLESLKHSIVQILTNEGWVSEGMLIVIDRMISNSRGTIMHKIKDQPMNVEDDLSKLGAIQHISREHTKKLREHTKSKWVDRRRKIQQ